MSQTGSETGNLCVEQDRIGGEGGPPAARVSHHDEISGLILGLGRKDSVK